MTNPLENTSRVELGPDALCGYLKDCTNSATWYVEAFHACGFKRSDPMCTEHRNDALLVPRLFGVMPIKCPGCNASILIMDLNTTTRAI